jgi:hypothetical protein
VLEDFAEFNLSALREDHVVRTDIAMADVLLLQVGDDVQERVKNIPDFAFPVECIKFLSFRDLRLQVICPVLVQQADGVEGRTEFLCLLRIVVCQMNELWMLQRLADL